MRWERILSDRIEIVERFYEGEFNDTKTDAGRRSIPFDSHGILRVTQNVYNRKWYAACASAEMPISTAFS